MGKYSETEKIVLLFDNYLKDSQNLHTSFKQAGKQYPTIVIEDDGFLPDDVISLFGSLLGYSHKSKEKPRYFNQIVVPEYWEITGNYLNGKIYDLKKERGRIFFAEPTHKRYVKTVDWLDETGVVRVSDHYNKYGDLYAKTIFNGMGQKVNKSYFSCDGKEIIVRNYVTGNIIFNDRDIVRIFEDLKEFIKFYFEKYGYDKSSIYYNSLSFPFFTSHSLQGEKTDVLFWHEPINSEIPGNMKLILNGVSKRTRKIVVQNKEAYQKLLSLGADKDMLKLLGYSYDFKRQNTNKAKALICTNSDNIAYCEKIVERLPQMHFNIIAITEMSSKLMSMRSYENVTLYPGVKMDTVKELFKSCDYYFDINYGNEILMGVWNAFLHNHLIFAFKETIHNRNYIAKEHIYSVNDVDVMINDIGNIIGNDKKMSEHINIQHQHALCGDKSEYLNI